jgi:hypothetical protein
MRPLVKNEMALLSHPFLSSLSRRKLLWAVWLYATVLLALVIGIASVVLDPKLLRPVALSAIGIWLAGGLIGTLLAIADKPD